MYSKQKNSIIKLCISYEKLREIIIKNPDNNIYEIYQLASNYTTLDIKGCFKWN